MSTPSKPLSIGQPKARGDETASQAASFNTHSAFGGATPAVGTPDLRALRAGYAGTPPVPNIPPRVAAVVAGGTTTPLFRPISSASLATSAPQRSSAAAQLGGISATRQQPQQVPSPTPVPISDLDDLPIEDRVEVLGRHLVPPELRTMPGSPTPDVDGVRDNGGNDSKSTATSVRSQPTENSGEDKSRGSSIAPAQSQQPQREDSEAFPITFHAPGADVTHDIYKWHSDQRRQVGRARAASFAGPSSAPHPAFEHIHEPGGFRRNYVKLRAEEQGTEEPQMLNNFIDFLLLFGHFAGEDLEDEEDEDKDAEAATGAGLEGLEEEPTESTSLLGPSGTSRSLSRSRRRRGSISGQGTASVTQAVLMLLKSFIGTGVLFLGKAFYNGGILFSSLTFIFIAVISLYSFLLLIKTKFVTRGSFGDIGGKLYGPWMRYLVLGSIVISQLGFVAAYTIFVAENLQSFVLGVTNCKKVIPVQYFILLELVFFLPLSLVRDLTKLSSTALIADGFILLGLLYIFGSEFLIIARRGVAEVKLFNSRDFPLFIGTAVFAFEGIGLIIPITDTMKHPQKFPMAMSGVMAFLLLLFGGAGILAYLTFGSDIQTVVLVNLDSHSKMVQSVQFLYALAILLSVPLQLFPAIRILENGLFTRSGKVDASVKWTKNIFRWSLVFFTTAISSWGAADLDKFVAFVGCFACVPLSYIYPAMLHYRACARTKGDKLKDIAMIIFGLIAFVYTTVETVRLMIQPASPNHSPHGLCKDRP